MSHGCFIRRRARRSVNVKQAAERAKIGIILLIVVLSAGCGAGGHQNTVPVTNWQIVTRNFATGEQHVYSLSEYPWSAGIASDRTVWFTFPNYSSADEAFHSENVVRLWELYSDRQRSLDGSDNVKFAFSISAQEGSTFFWKTEANNVCNTPAAARPMFVAWYQGPFQPTDEWWADNAFTLANESSSLQVPLKPDHWSDVYGHRANVSASALAAFDFSKANVQAYGMSFGGGCFSGHGVSTIGGTAKFEAHVQPDLEQ